jgi:hypothetical protein
MTLPKQCTEVRSAVVTQFHVSEPKVSPSKTPLHYKRCTGGCAGSYEVYSEKFSRCMDFCKCVHWDDRDIFSCLLDMIKSPQVTAPV